MDQSGNMSWTDPILITTGTISLYTGNVLTFEFSDVGDAAFSKNTTPSVYYSVPEETEDFWMGKKGITGGDGTVVHDSGPDHYLHTFSSANGGSLTIQSVSPGVDPDPNPVGRSYTATNDLASFYKWIYHPNYPTPGKTYYRGISGEADISIVGDKNGMCAAWDTYPALGGCAVTYDLGHQASDWGASFDAKNTIWLSVKDGLQLDAAEHEGFGATGNGFGIWVSARAGNLDDPSDDILMITDNNYPLVGPLLAVQFLDGLGLGLVPDRNRNGIIEGTGNCVKIKVAAAPASDDGQTDYLDVWFTRPGSSEPIHVNPLNCSLASGWGIRAGQDFGREGHTMTRDTKGGTGGDDKVTWSHAQLGIRDMVKPNYYNGNIFGIQYNTLTLRNDWDADISIAISDLTDLHKLGVGSKITWDGSGSELIVTIDPITFDMGTYFFYIEKADRSIGIKVADHSTMMPMVWKGQKIVSMQAFLARDDDGNPYLNITDLSCVADTASGTVEPIGINNLSVGGQEATGGAGLSNVGLLATVWGEVTDVQYDAYGSLYFKLNDGSGTEIRVLDSLFDGMLLTPAPAIGEYWSAIGAVALESDGVGGFTRAIILDSAQKLN